jgi:hypothetical protein
MVAQSQKLYLQDVTFFVELFDSAVCNEDSTLFIYEKNSLELLINQLLSLLLWAGCGL